MPIRSRAVGAVWLLVVLACRADARGEHAEGSTTTNGVARETEPRPSSDAGTTSDAATSTGPSERAESETSAHRGDSEGSSSDEVGTAETAATSAREEDLAFVAAPTFLPNPHPAAPQVGLVRVETTQPATVELDIAGGGETWSLVSDAATHFTRPILGLKPETTYTVRVTATGGGASITAEPLTWTTPPLPPDFPHLDLRRSEPTAMEPGMPLFHVRTGWSAVPSILVIVDHEGVVRWYFADADLPAREDPRRLADGTFTFCLSRCALATVDVLGEVVGSWHAAEYPSPCTVPADAVPVPTLSFHHDVSRLESGDFLVLSTEARVVEDYPTSEEDPDAPTETATVLGSVIVEFTPSGEITKEISMLDLLDPTRIGRDSLDTSWPSGHLPDDTVARDWDHANAVVYDAPSDAYYVSLRHQDAVIKVDRASETLTWILGTHANWREPWSDRLLTPVGALAWPFHQHAMEPTPLGLGMYDNGNHRAAAFEPRGTEYSRVVVYAIDEAAMTVEQVWAYGPPEGEEAFFSSAMGDFDALPETGNVLLVNSQVVAGRASYGEIVEVSPDGSRVFHLRAGGAEGTVYTINRAERVPDMRFW